ncbi:Rqc2 family fibronectin-binding protein [Clostridium oryzae]|uniref:Rqc2 homolog RqcH n=1 Tax=Clostridium oryzae TaxID=1450648 RepID=A0A1V4ITK3_9CLOT|nr:NFACT RNA binding domain-containing protein [Clostridium oryzae]OPJ63223.1 hypothetical protein CLORY_13060 [Clostridium oryzae]
MALDGVFLYALDCELKNSILNSRVDKVNQPERDEVVLTFRGGNAPGKLVISASANYPRAHFTKISKPNPNQPPMFCMVLRKYLIGSRVVDVKQINGDRILVIQFESSDELGFDSVYSLIIEIMGRHSNITLVRNRDNIVMDSIKHITPDINSFRSLYPNIEYVYPPASTKLNPMDFTYSAFQKYINENNITFEKDTAFCNVFSGVSKPLSRYIYNTIKRNELVADGEESNSVFSYLTHFFSSLSNCNFMFLLFMDELNNYKDFYCSDIYEDYKKIEVHTASELLDRFYYEKDKQDRLNQKSSDLHKLVTNNVDRCIKKQHILEKTLTECKTKDKYQLYGELLTANIYNIQHGSSSIEVLNYYSDNGETINIPLDITKSASENVQSYYKKYNKLKKSEEAALLQLEHNNEELDYLQSVLTNISNCDNYIEIQEIRNELMETGYIRFRKLTKKNKTKQTKPLHYVSSDGNDIYVGKNNIQNDFLTLKFADKRDIWFHTKNIPGSHVIVKADKPVSEKTLEEAATIAAFYSKGKDSSKVAVDYTEIRNVKKPSGAKPGMVIYYTNKTIYAEPKEPKKE